MQQSKDEERDLAERRKEKSKTDLVVKVASQPVQEVATLGDKKNLDEDLKLQV